MCGRAGTRKKRKKLVITVNSAKFTRARAEPSARARDALLIPKPGITETLIQENGGVETLAVKKIITRIYPSSRRGPAGKRLLSLYGALTARGKALVQPVL